MANDPLPDPKLLVSAERLKEICPQDGSRRCVMIRDAASTQVQLRAAGGVWEAHTRDREGEPPKSAGNRKRGRACATHAGGSLKEPEFGQF